MKRIKFMVRHLAGGESWEEETNCPGDVTPEAHVRMIIKRFNSSLRPQEKAREFVSVVGESDRLPDHDWEKQNLFTIIDHGRNYDIHKCRVCGVTGKRFGLGGIMRDKKFSAKKYQFCQRIANASR